MSLSVPRVLIVEDSPASAKTLKLVLVAEGYGVECAGTAAEAVEVAQGGPFDAALIDITLPDRSGIDLLLDLKQAQPELVTIMVTGHASTESSIEALNRGASGYVQKPVEMQQLLQLLRNGLERKRLEEQNQQMLRRLSLLHAIGAAVSSGLEPSTTLTETISLVTSLLDVPAGGIWWSTDPDSPRLAASVGMPDSETRQFADHVAELSRQLVERPELAAQPCIDRMVRWGENGETCSFRFVPLRGASEAVGWMVIGGPGWSEESTEGAEVLGAVAGQVGVSMENMRLFEDLRTAHHQLKEAQAQLVQSEKLSAVGRFVSGVAHELNNPLMAVIGYAELLADGGVDTDACAVAGRIRSQARRCGDIVQGLLAFARQEHMDLARVDMNELVAAAVEAADHQRGPATKVDCDLDPSISPVAGDATTLQQVLVNILTNAYQAIDGEGTVTVRSWQENGLVGVAVQDSGPGLPQDVLPRVFDPFFTTKPVGQGTGLGLSVSHGIVKDHGGELQADNAAEGGAIFTLRLPIAQSPAN